MNGTTFSLSSNFLETLQSQDDALFSSLCAEHCESKCAVSLNCSDLHCVSQNVVQMISSHGTWTDLHCRGRRQKNISDNCHGFWFTIIRRKKMSEFSIPASAYMRSCWKTIATTTILLIAWSSFVSEWNRLTDSLQYHLLTNPEKDPKMTPGSTRVHQRWP